MNKQRKVLITITYNEMGVIIDTKTVELGSSAQPEPCEDTISRQAAIDELVKMLSDCFYADEEVLDAVKTTLKELPPALREQHHDEWCTNCKEYDYENSCCHRWTKVIRQTRRELQDEFVMTAVDGTLWVTVDDVQKVGRVIVDEDKSKFCRQFYMDAQPEQRTEILYRHYKGGTYELVCNNVTHTETGESLVIYRDCRGQMWARPESMFYGLVKVGDDLVPRFVLCQSEGDAE